MRALIGCESSGRVRDEFSIRGWDAWSCDIVPTESPGKHHLADIFDIITAPRVFGRWDLFIAHPPCTYLCNSGIRWLYKDGIRWVSPGKENPIDRQRWKLMEEGAEFFNRLWHSNHTKHICMENPRPHPYASERIGPSTQVIQPWMFGDYATKETHLWIRGLPLLVPVYKTAEECRIAHGIPEGKKPSNEIHFASPGPNRGKIRSMTFPGIARAFAEQWG